MNIGQCEMEAILLNCANGLLNKYVNVAIA